MNSKRYTNVRFTSDAYNALTSYLLHDNNEKHAFCFGRRIKGTDKEVILVDRVIGFDEKEIAISPVSVRIDAELANGVFHRFLESDYDVLISTHSHPFEKGDVAFSSIDDENDIQLSEYFYNELVGFKPNAAFYTMVFGQKTVAAREYDLKKKRFQALERITILDIPLQEIIPTNHRKSNKMDRLNKRYHRQVLAFGEEGQKRLAAMKIGVVGVGGTGSIMVEGLVRLGAKRLVLIDEDRLEDTNLNRWQGAHANDVGKLKVKVAKNRLKKIDPHAQIDAHAISLFCKEAIDALKDCDMLIGTVDSDEARYILNRMSLCYLIPYMDCSSGVVVSTEGRINQVAARNVTVVPSKTECFVCTDHYLDKSKLAYAFLPKYMRTELTRQKYIVGEDVPSPGVYGLNMMSVSLLLLELMNMVFGYKKRHYANIYIDFMRLDDSVSTAWSYELPHQDCIECHDRLAKGDLERIWELFPDPKDESVGFKVA